MATHIDKMSLIPFELLEDLSRSVRNNNIKRHIGDNRGKVQVFVTKETRDALSAIKIMNKLSSMNSSIDLLIATVGMFQYQNPEYAKDIIKHSKEELNKLKNNRGERPCIIEGERFKSINQVGKHHKIHAQTVHYRLTSKSLIYREWNLEGEDVLAKYINAGWNKGALELTEKNTKGWS